MEALLDALANAVDGLIFILILAVLFIGPGLLVPINRMLKQRHERKLRKLEVREREAEAKRLAAEAKLLEDKKNADMPEYLDRSDPSQVEEWRKAKQEADRIAAKAAVVARKARS